MDKKSAKISRMVNFKQQLYNGAKLMIEYKKQYEAYLIKNGVGINDIVADSKKSYISYLNGTSKYLDIDINQCTLSTETDIQNLSVQLSETKKISVKTIKNYISAMRQYINMIQELKLHIV